MSERIITKRPITDIMDDVSEKNGITKTLGQEILKTLIEEMKKSFKSGMGVSIYKFGTFNVKYVKAKDGYSRYTGLETMKDGIMVVEDKPEHNAIRFNSSGTLKNEMFEATSDNAFKDDIDENEED